MGSPNRISPLSITPTVERQTPHQEFGALLAAHLSEVAQAGVGVLGGAFGLHPAASAAVAGLSAVRTSNGLTSLPAVPNSTLGGGGALGDSSTPALLQQLATGHPSEAVYLQLQMQMQEESQRYSAVSNILKVRSDAAKGAINNVR